MVLEHWKDRHHDLILGNKTPHSTFVPLNSRNQMRMNTSNLNINIKSLFKENSENMNIYEKYKEIKPKGQEENHLTTAIHRSIDFRISGCKA